MVDDAFLWIHYVHVHIFKDLNPSVLNLIQLKQPNLGSEDVIIVV